MCINPGIIPILALPGDISPGQLGPISLTPFPFIELYTAIISRAGIPSVMHTISLIPAFAASKIASAANAGGTNIADASAFTACTASATVLNIGTFVFSNIKPPLPGVTPATTFVPYSIICFAWKEPSLPVIP